MHTTRKILALGVLLVAAASPASGEDIESFAARAPSAEAYPDDDALVLYEEVSLTLHPDGRVERYVRHVRKYFTPYEVDSHADPRIAWDAETQALEILAWRTVPPGGGVIEKKDRAFNQVTPDATGRAPDYASLREMVATHLGMEEGAVVEREYVIRDLAAREGGLSGVEFFEGRLPVLEKVVRIRVPRGTAVRFVAVGGEASHREDAEGGTVTHLWRMENLPGVPPASVAGIERDALPHLVYSTASRWADVAEVWRGRLGPSAELTGRLADKLEDITRPAGDEHERVRRIHEAVLEGVRLIAYDFPLHAIRCRSAERVYDSGYGHGADRAVLLLAWLRGAGIDAHPVMVSRSLRFAEDVPCADLVPDIWVVARTSGGDIWMDPTRPLASASGKDLAGHRVLRLSGPHGLVQIPERTVDENGCVLRLTASVEKDGSLEGEARLRLTGVFSPYYEVSGVGDEAKTYVSSVASSVFGGVEVETYNFQSLSPDAVALGFRFRRDSTDEGSSILDLPGFPEPVEIAGFEPTSPERRATLVLPGPFVASVEADIDLWEGAKITCLPDPVEARAPFGTYRLRCEEREGTLHFERRMKITGRTVTPEAYPEFRRLVVQDRNPIRSTVVLSGE